MIDVKSDIGRDKNMNENTPSVVVKPDVYEKMLKSAIILRNQIRDKNEKGLEATKEEADFVNDFESYTKELFEAIEEQENI